jgi:hypothetical protein
MIEADCIIEVANSTPGDNHRLVLKVGLFDPLSLTLSRRERGLKGWNAP